MAVFEAANKQIISRELINDCACFSHEVSFLLLSVLRLPATIWGTNDALIFSVVTEYAVIN
jgi:hypothetical protein